MTKLVGINFGETVGVVGLMRCEAYGVVQRWQVSALNLSVLRKKLTGYGYNLQLLDDCEAKAERAAIKALGWDKQRIATYMKKWKAGRKVRLLQNQVIAYYSSAYYVNRYGDGVKNVPIQEGLPTIAELEEYIYPQHEERFREILKGALS